MEEVTHENLEVIRKQIVTLGKNISKLSVRMNGLENRVQKTLVEIKEVKRLVNDSNRR